jgi:glycosyltransferase involved in cell wall biosynthesis
VVTIHDAIHLERPGDRSPLAYPYALLFLTRALCSARIVVTATEDARRRLLALVPDAAPRLRVVPHGVDLSMTLPPTDAEREAARAAAGGPFALYVGNDLPHKNLDTLVGAFLSVQGSLPAPRPRLVVVGPSPASRRAWRDLLAAGTEDRVAVLGRVDARLLRALYAEASLLAFPSLAEGFGLPPLEAFAQGTPVLAAETAAVREVLGPLARYGDGTSGRSFAPALAAALATGRGSPDDQVARQRHAARFSWSAAARATLAAYRDATAGES